MKRIREVLVNEYIGAVAIGLILASAITGLIGVVVQTLALYWNIRHEAHSIFEPARSIPWGNLISGLVPVALYFLAAYVLLRWLYLRRDVPAKLESEQVQPDSSAKDDVKS